jgi:hypothetical protein
LEDPEGVAPLGTPNIEETKRTDNTTEFENEENVRPVP